MTNGQSEVFGFCAAHCADWVGCRDWEWLPKDQRVSVQVIPSEMTPSFSQVMAERFVGKPQKIHGGIG